MLRRTAWTVAIVIIGGSASWAGDGRVELGATAGWTFSDGVSGNATTIPTVGTFDRIDPKDAFSWGARLGFMATDNVEVGALFNQQSTSLELGGTSTATLGDLSVYNYHGYVAYNFGDADAKARPYLLGGLGATQFGTVHVDIAGTQKDVSGQTKFSTTWALGVKVNASKNVGVRLEGRWTPTYIKSDASGWWCDPYWGCYVTGNAQYANQFELAGGITLKF